MKFCTKCGNGLADDARFCDKCGNAAVVQNNVQAPQQPVNQTYYSQPAQAPQQPRPASQNPRRKPPKKKKNTGVIIGVVAAVAILLAIIGSCSEKKFQEQGYGQDSGNDYTSIDQNESPVFEIKSYTKGVVENGIYVNEWADLCFDLGSDWTEGTYDEYAAFSGDGKTECGLLLSDQVNGKQLTIAFEKLGGVNLLISEDDYLDIVAGGMVEQFTGAGLACSASEYFDYPIADETYRGVKIQFDDNSMVQHIYVRSYDGYMTFIMVLAYDEYDAVSTVNDIYPAN